MKTRIFTMVVAGLIAGATASYAQEGPNSGDREGAAGMDCAYLFAFPGTQGSYCISAAGNVSRFASPFTAEHIFNATPWEGYVICSGTTPLYWDTGSSASGFGIPLLVTGPSVSSVTIRRATTDGNFQLDQKFQRDTKTLGTTITMTLSKLGGPPTPDVRIARVVDFDNDNTSGGDNQDRTDRSVNGREIHGLVLTSTSFTLQADTAIQAAGGDHACSPASVAVPTLLDGFASVTVRKGGALNTGQSFKVIFRFARY